ncbi:MAG TPA: TonB-dependent receptor [Membranihabitans sp.]|nr:TonB-dependent receptor [Membranihabitans sp.]
MDLRSLIVVVMIVIGPLSAGHSHPMAGIPEEISHLRVIHTDAFIRDAESIALDISGTVMDNEGNPLIGVNIRVKGTDFGTATDADGAFYLEDVDEEAILVFSYIGYQTKEVSVAGNTSLTVTLLSDSQLLDEVVVVGYGTQTKRDLTGSVAQISNKELESVPVYNVGEALQGRASGVSIVNNSGAPGSRVQVRIRGGNSMIGSNDPLYVVDGFPLVGGLNFINPADIETIDVLKDASATAIYGARGANGVVMITTKSGKGSETGTVSINSYYGMQNTAKRFDMLNAEEYAIVANEFLKNNGGQPYFNESNIPTEVTDWQDVIFRAAPVQNHTLSFTGGSGKTSYSLSGNYYLQDGIIINSGVEKGLFRFNLNHEIKSWLNLSVNLNASRREQQSVPVDNGRRGNNLLSGALAAAPGLSVYDENGLPTRIGEVYPFTDPGDMRNPMLWAEPYKNSSFANTVLLNSLLDFKITEDLSFSTRLGLEYENARGNGFSPIIYPNDRGGASTSNGYWNSFLNENILTYSKTFASIHKLTALAGVTYQNYSTRGSGISVSGFTNNITQDYNLGSAETTNPASSYASEWTLLSGLGRVNYSFMDKYYVTASIRADGSSRFGKDNKWGVFPSGALAWRVSEESFMKDNIGIIDNLKLRLSYGVLGNTAVSPYQSLDRLIAVNYIYAGEALNIGYAPAGISNSQLKWETTREIDLGFDLSVLNSRLNFTFDYYKKNTEDLLASVPLAPSVGFGSILQNLGEIQNQGVEFGLEAFILEGDFSWNVSGNLSINRNEVKEIAGGSDVVTVGQTSGLPGYNIARIGEPLGSFYGYEEDGLDETGQIKFVDHNGDGEITPLDRVILGSPYPDFEFGFNTDFSYKNFNLNIFMQGVHGNDIFFATAFTNLNSFQRTQNQFADLIGNYWTEANPDPNAKYPKLSALTQMRPSDRFIFDGTYLKLKSVQLSYNLPVVNLNWISNATIYVKATNLYTFTSYIGLDPDVNTRGSDSQSIENRLFTGTDETGYPSPRIFGAGINLSF